MAVDGWYLMTTDEIVKAVGAWRSGSAEAFPPSARLSTDAALAFRDAGNLPDDHGRTLRLVLEVEEGSGVGDVSMLRMQFEPDFHAAPSWRRQGSVPVNVVPLRRRESDSRDHDAWWKDDKVAPLETEWMAKGTVAGLAVPGEYRSFVFKTVIALRAAEREVTPDSILDSVARWLTPDEVAKLRAALTSQAN